MRGKRSKQYRKLMQQYCLTFGFREPYQVLVDAQMIQDADRFKMDLTGSLERVLHGKVKPLITQCSIRHLYTLPSTPSPQKDSLIAIAKGMERRRCNHHTLETPLTTLECLSSVIDSKKSKINKNRYVVASQEEEVRRYCRSVKGVPLVYVKRSVMIMEPMTESSINVREGLERGKFRTGLRGKGQNANLKRKRYDDTSDAEAEENKKLADSDDQQDETRPPKKRKIRGLKGPNPLSMKKSQKGSDKGQKDAQRSPENANARKLDSPTLKTVDILERPSDELQKPPVKRKRKRKHKPALLVELEDKGEDSKVRS